MIIFIKWLVALIFTLLIFGQDSVGQIYEYFTLDSALSINSEQFGIGANGKSEKIKMAVLGPYQVGYIDKLDSGKYKTKTKEGKDLSYDTDNGFDEFKTTRFESHAYYRMGLGKNLDSVTCLFSYFSSHREKTETVLGTLMSKKEGSADARYFDENRLLQGTISVLDEQDIWRFMLFYPPTGFGILNRNIQGYLTDGRDSLRIDFVYAEVIKKNKKDVSQEKLMMRSPRGYTLVDFENKQVAALIFKQDVIYLGAKKIDNFTNGELGIIGNDNRKSAKLAIAAFFSIMVGIQ